MCAKGSAVSVWDRFRSYRHCGCRITRGRRFLVAFFAIFNTWLNGILTGYIGNNTAKIASLLQPAVLTLATVYVMVWGYLQLTGKTEEPIVTGVKRIILLVVIVGGALDLWLYN